MKIIVSSREINKNVHLYNYRYSVNSPMNADFFSEVL